MAAPLSYHKNKFNIAAIVISSMLFLPSKPVVLGFPSYSMSDLGGKEKLQVGSRPPRCLNKCSSCRPCMATLVIQPDHKKRFEASGHDDEGGDHDVYYHLSWKCKCGNKLYHP
ncbi:hypothetical protein V6N13_057796 [Hibiscus sabdariffa]|uniref:Epidermal patterning factor-like protein n=1 Tax=Hibiscus sabdariffa TaxID=183260 RepID=A0ABR2GI19_9ROSI